MNIESMMLYNDVATMAMMAGTEYCTSSFVTDCVPSVRRDASAAGAVAVVTDDELFELLSDIMYQIVTCKYDETLVKFNLLYNVFCAEGVNFAVLKCNKMSKTDLNSPRWGALFDLDGVLIDSEGIYTEFWHDIDTAYPTGVADFEYVIKGNTLEAILDTYFPDAEVRRVILERLKEHEQSMRYVFFDGVEDFLRRLKAGGIPMAIVTSSNRVKMRHLFESLPVLEDLIDVVITGDDVTRSKPDPQGYNMAAARLGLDPNRCVVFEDSLAGVEAGRRAGGAVVAIATTNPADRLRPMADMVIDNVADASPADLAALVTP